MEPIGRVNLTEGWATDVQRPMANLAGCGAAQREMTPQERMERSIKNSHVDIENFQALIDCLPRVLPYPARAALNRLLDKAGIS